MSDDARISAFVVRTFAGRPEESRVFPSPFPISLFEAYIPAKNELSLAFATHSEYCRFWSNASSLSYLDVGNQSIGNRKASECYGHISQQLRRHRWNLRLLL